MSINSSQLVYLDYNVILLLSEKKTSLDKVYDIIGTQDIIFPYSHAHVEEIDNLSQENPNRDLIIASKIQSLNEITKKNYLNEPLHERNHYYLHKNHDASIVLNTIREVPFAKPMMKELANMVGEDQRQSFRNLLEIDSREINNYTPDQVLDHLNYMASLYNMNFQQFLDHSVSFYPEEQRKQFGFSNTVAAVFEMLDIVGYWKDNYKENSNFARLWDALHCANATACSYFITNDKRTMNKAKVVYSLYDIPTKVASLKHQ